jgi:hypothetical protein
MYKKIHKNEEHSFGKKIGVLALLLIASVIKNSKNQKSKSLK